MPEALLEACYQQVEPPECTDEAGDCIPLEEWHKLLDEANERGWSCNERLDDIRSWQSLEAV